MTTFSELVEACKATFLLDFRLTESWGESKERGLTCQNREGGGGRGRKTLHSLNIPDTDSLNIPLNASLNILLNYLTFMNRLIVE